MALNKAHEELAHSQQAVAKQVSSDSESDLQRVMGVLAKKTQECDQLREVRNLASLLSEALSLAQLFSSQPC